MSECVTSPPLSRKSLAQKARRERERHDPRFLSVRQRSPHRARRERRQNISSPSSLPCIVTRHFPSDIPRSSFQFANIGTSESASNNMSSGGILNEEITHGIGDIANQAQERHSLGRMAVTCRDCLALHWKAEELSNSRVNDSLFGMCCLQGKIRLPLLSPLPPAFQSLYEDSNPLAKSFRKDIRSYNASNALTSLGVTMDDRILTGRGPEFFVYL